MKPILHIQIPRRMETDTAQLVKTIAKALKEKLLNDYEVIFSPTDSGMTVKSEGTVVNLVIDSSTNFDELFKKLDEIANLKRIANDMKQIAIDHPEIKIESALTTDFGLHNKNRRAYPSELGIAAGVINESDYPITLAPRGIVGDDGKLKIISMDYISENLTISTKPLKARSPLMPILYDPFGDFEAARKNSDEFHRNFMPSGEYSCRSYDGDLEVDPEKCLDEYWFPIIDKVNNTDFHKAYILLMLKKGNINPNLLTSITNSEGCLNFDVKEEESTDASS